MLLRSFHALSCTNPFLLKKWVYISHLLLLALLFFLFLCVQSNSMASTSTCARQQENKITNAFEGIAPSSASTSTATSSKLPCDVFINHRGPDVKHTLARSIYHALNSLGLRVFLDSEELQLGDFLPTTIQDSMRSASLHIAIFSQSYAQSPWCLAELSFMLKTGTTIIPVFYHVQPADLRWIAQGKGIYKDAFSEHERKGRYPVRMLEEWKMALHNVSFYTGEIINNNDDERRVLKNIVNCVMKVMKKVPLEVAKHPVGLNEAVEEFERTALQSAQGHENVQIVGIWGMGGSGKTTLAKELYNQKCTSMQRSSFLFDVRDAASKSLLHKKQKKLLQDLGVQHDHLSFDNIEEGKGILSSRLRSVRVLVILDDVDHVDQLDALLPTKDSLGRGSLIVVTSREMEVLRSWGISSVYKMRLLDRFHAEQLFCWHAFLQPSPMGGLERLVEKFVDACHGLPLSLKVFGAQLYGNSCNADWESLLDKIKRILPKDIIDRLKISYDALDEEEKEAFLDTACFLIGEERNVAIEVWDGSDWSGRHSWERLVNKCLVELDESNCIRMHDHLRDLGRKIANSQSPSRIWNEAQIMDIEKQAEERIQIRGMILEAAVVPNNALAQVPDFSLHMKLLVNRRFPIGLKVLVAGGCYLNEQIAELSRELVWLRWSNFACRNLPSWLSLKYLRVLQLKEAQNLRELWKDASDAPVQLRELVIDSCSEFRRFPRSIGCLKDLRKIVVTFPRSIECLEDLRKMGGSKVSSLPEEFCLLQSLEHLMLLSCRMLSSLPSNFGNLTNLRHLDLSNCFELRMLPDTFKQLTLLQHLNLESCQKLILGSDILENMTKLEYLNLSGCVQVEELPSHITNQACLRWLYLQGTGLRELPVNIGELKKLRVMWIGSPLLTSFPASLGNLSSLTSLQIFRCELLTSLPTCLDNLSSLTELLIDSCSKLESLPDSVGRLNLLQSLTITSSGVKSLPKSLTQLSNLQTLVIQSCPISQLDFGRGSFTTSLCNLKNINLFSTRVSKISISEECCPSFEMLLLLYNHQLMEMEALPSTVRHMELQDCGMLKNIRVIGGLVNLQRLVIRRCGGLDVLPSFEKLTCLKEFILEGCDKVEKIEGLDRLRSLEELEANILMEVPCVESLECMENLRRLQLTAKKRSSVERCIQTIQKWPGQVMICTKAVGDAGSVLNQLAFPGLSVVDSFHNRKIDSSPFLFQKCSINNGDAIMVCFVINCVSPHMGIEFVGNYNYCYRAWSGNIICSTVVDEGKWVWISAFTQRSSCFSWRNYGIRRKSWEGGLWHKNDSVDKALLVMGKEKRIVETFHQLLESL